MRPYLKITYDDEATYFIIENNKDYNMPKVIPI
jgi:hypothetical protein